jgi:hypothetical protein
MQTASIIRAMALMMEAVSTSATSVNFYQTTRRNIQEDSNLQKDGSTKLHFNEVETSHSHYP